ncbi:hypothetical protein FisN_14Lu399 [Fistulifera solaris]|uniref:Uncharacterized protein n=1 Tax=Fistulifera solaris TaxID=1519565 RepID=A0A1Z5JHV7_FISSO|nr:hypothetical protein FisN_14Lu399 [Fistulifera solaris]|eukprot:GAX13603.1 hypothetical protein FisN_14Lu399 [Fistulifera solaris]
MHGKKGSSSPMSFLGFLVFTTIFGGLRLEERSIDFSFLRKLLFVAFRLFWLVMISLRSCVPGIALWGVVDAVFHSPVATTKGE